MNASVQIWFQFPDTQTEGADPEKYFWDVFQSTNPQGTPNQKFVFFYSDKANA